MSVDRPQIAIYPPIAFVLALIAALVLHRFIPLGLLPETWPTGRVIGGFLFCAAASFGAAGVMAFRTVGTPVSPHNTPKNLATSGVYRITRNPMYLGLGLMLASVAFLFSIGWALPFAAILIGVLHFGVVIPEERYLINKFGEEYKAFLASTRRWL